MQNGLEVAACRSRTEDNAAQPGAIRPAIPGEDIQPKGTRDGVAHRGVASQQLVDAMI
jgi:hypothetical protein